MEPIDPFLLRSHALALSSQTKGNHPFGAVLVHEGRIVAVAENTVISDKDVSAHAEMNLIRLVAGSLSQSVLSSCILYASTEPCAMCSGAIYWAGIGSIVYGCSNRVLSEIVGGGLKIPCRDILLRGNKEFNISGPVAETHFRGIHDLFWRDST